MLFAMDTRARIEEFVAQSRFAVVGASRDRGKYGNKCLRCYQQHDLDVVPIHPREAEIEGLPTSPSLDAVQPPPEAITIVTPPRISLAVIEAAARLGIRHVWLQPGAEDAEVLRRADELELPVIAGGPCLLVRLGFRDEA